MKDMELIKLSELTKSDKIELIESRIEQQQKMAAECKADGDYESEAVHLKYIDGLIIGLGRLKSDNTTNEQTNP